MNVYIYDEDFHTELDYRLPSSPGDTTTKVLAKFDGLSDFNYDEKSGEYETDQRTFRYWEERLELLENINNKMNFSRNRYGDKIVYAIMERAATYSDIDEVVACYELWLERLPAIFTKEVKTKEGIVQYLACQDEFVTVYIDDVEWLDEYVGKGATAEEAVVDYIQKAKYN